MKISYNELIKTRKGYRIMLTHYPSWFIADNFLLNLYTDAYYNIVDKTGSCFPNAEMLEVVNYQYKRLCRAKANG